MSEPSYPRVEVSCAGSPALITTVRRFVSDLYTQATGDPKLASRVALATHELLENAVKYAADRSSHFVVEFAERDGTVCVSTRNRASPDNLAMLRTMFHEMAYTPDALDYYLMVMRRSALRSEGSGLGLARVRHEAESVLELHVEDDARVQVTARIAPHAGGAR